MATEDRDASFLRGVEEAAKICDAVKNSQEILKQKRIGDQAYVQAGIDWCEFLAGYIRQLKTND